MFFKFPVKNFFYIYIYRKREREREKAELFCVELNLRKKGWLVIWLLQSV